MRTQSSFQEVTDEVRQQSSQIPHFPPFHNITEILHILHRKMESTLFFLSMKYKKKLTGSSVCTYMRGACLPVFWVVCFSPFLPGGGKKGRILLVITWEVEWEEKGTGALRIFDITPLSLVLYFPTVFSLLCVLELRVSLVHFPQG